MRAAHTDARRPARARAALLLACCLLLTACPPEGGRLAPVLLDGGGVRITSRAGVEVLEVTRDGVTMAAGGRWSVADAATSVILEVKNANAEEMSIDFGGAHLKLGDASHYLALRSLADEGEPGGPVKFLRERRVTVGGGRGARFALEFWLDGGDGRAGVARDMSGRAVILRIPAELRRATPAEVDFVFLFKYSESR